MALMGFFAFIWLLCARVDEITRAACEQEGQPPRRMGDGTYESMMDV